jgi:hypothetical protein
MVDEHAARNRGSGVDFNAREPPRHVRNEATQPSETGQPASVRKAMHEQRMEARVAGEDFPRAARCRIALENDRNLFL